ncbi:hypothetical protein [Nocardia sp. NPDC003963]
MAVHEPVVAIDRSICAAGECGHGESVRLTAPDLVTAQERRKRLAAQYGDSPGNAALVLLDVVAHIAARAHEARYELAAAEANGRCPSVPRGENICYTGTPAGLVRLISDIVVAGVADGVTLIPAIVGGAGRESFDRLLAYAVMPALTAPHGPRTGPPPAVIRGLEENR